MLRMINQLYIILINIFNTVLKITSEKDKEYYLKLDSYYQSKHSDCIFVILRVRNKRCTFKLPVSKVVLDKDIIRELHPADACMIGFLANTERNSTGKLNYQLNLVKNYSCATKTTPILKIIKKYFDKGDREVTVLYSPLLKKEIRIPTLELVKNEALLYALDPFQAISLGYDASEIFLRNLKPSI